MVLDCVGCIEEVLYLMFLGMMIVVGGDRVLYWIAALFLDCVAHHNRYKCIL